MSAVAPGIDPEHARPDTLKTKGDFSGFKIAKSEDGIEMMMDLDPAQTVSVYFAMQQYLFPDKAS